MSEPLWTTGDWTFNDIQQVYDACEDIAINELKLDVYQNQMEVITSEQMLDAYASIGLPLMYKHWSFGKQFAIEQTKYKKGYSGLAYEMVINSNPCVNYLMEDNTMTTQALVIAHAAFGHNHFFKNNYLYKEWTDAESIVDYLKFAKDYIDLQETKHGRAVVEEWIDSCHTITDYGVNRYKRPTRLNMVKEKKKQQNRLDYAQSRITDLYRILPKEKIVGESSDKFLSHPEENLMYFFEKYSPDLENWQREILRIVRKLHQYLYPQGQTKVINEGFASITHYETMTRLHEKGLMTDGAFLEFLEMHTNVLMQPDFDSKYFSGWNPYALGFAMLRDIKRMCANPTEEDLRWFPQIKGRDGQDMVLEAVANFRDESFIRQWLSPKVMRDFKIFSVFDDKADKTKMFITSIHNDRGYQEIREKLADQYLRALQVPQLEAVNVDKRSRTLYIQYTPQNGRTLSNHEKMIKHLGKLWSNYPVIIHNEKGDIIASTIPIPKEPDPPSTDYSGYCDFG